MSSFVRRSTSCRFTSLAILATLVFLAPRPDSVAAEPVRPRNVLFLIADDLNNFLGCYGDRQAKTPNIDRIAARGVTFQHAYCTFPLCGPSRNSMLTGLYPNSTGIHQNSQIFRQTVPSAISLPQAFRLQGYFAGRIGKLYHYNVPNSIGTNGHDDPGSWELELNPAGIDRLEEHAKIYSLRPKQFGGTLSWYASPGSDRDHTDGKMAQDAAWVLERCAAQRERPFFLAVGFFRPHTPYVAPKEPYFGLYPKDQMRVVSGIKEDQADLPAAALGSFKNEESQLTDDLRREALQAYYASISFMDAQVGVVLDALDRLGLTDDTTIVFTSDHGYHTGEHGLWQKRSLFEESARVPLLIVAPGIAQAGAVAKTPVSHLDLYPTLTSLCHVKPPENLQGQDLVPLLKDPSQVGRGWALTQVSRGNPQVENANRKGTGTKANSGFYGYSLRTERWRFTEWDQGNEGRELYDHQNDPRELTNLAEDPQHAVTVRDLRATLQSAVKQTYPPSGESPTMKPETWAPLLLNP